MLPHQAAFGDFVDSLREETGRQIKYQSVDWWIAYRSYIQGKHDATKEMRQEVAA